MRLNLNSNGYMVMGHLLYDMVKENTDVDFNIRVYAPVGAHKDLLPYLVRRLLENGANSSFVNRFMDKDVSVEELMQDNIKMVEEKSPKRHSMIPLPADILSYSKREKVDRKNAAGFELTDPLEIDRLNENLSINYDLKAGPIVSGELKWANIEDVYNPTTSEVMGKVSIAGDDDIERALNASAKAQKSWNSFGWHSTCKNIKSGR